MNIVLEGPDGGGKSTLGEFLSINLDARLQQGSGPPRTPDEIRQRASQYLRMTDTVFDRHPCISQPIYGTMRGVGADLPGDSLVREFYAQRPLVIYCRSVSAERHRVKDGENPAHVEMLTARYIQLVQLYDAWAMDHAHVVYRIGDDQGLILDICRAVRGDE